MKWRRRKAQSPKTMGELLDSILPILPNAQIEEDNDGQLIIYTGLVEVNADTGHLAPFEGDTFLLA